MLGNGWYKGRFGFIDKMDRLYGDTQAVICELEIVLQNGDKITISSDESFRCQKSPVLESSIYDGEVYDANLVPKEDKWVQAVPAKEEIQKWSEKLTPRYSLPLIAHEALKACGSNPHSCWGNSPGFWTEPYRDFHLCV